MRNDWSTRAGGSRLEAWTLGKRGFTIAGAMAGLVVIVLVIFAIMAVVSSKSVDSTEHCIQTRYGRVVNEKMSTGFNFIPFSSATCFSMTDQNFPENGDAETVPVTTKDPVTVNVDVSLIWAYDPANVYQVFLDKRSPERVQSEVYNAMREGVRSALASWTIADIFSARRAAVADSIREHVQRKLGARGVIRTIFVRNIVPPQSIETARTEAAKQAQVLAAARQQFQIDSVRALGTLQTAEANAKAQKLLADAYAQNPELLQLEAARAMAQGLAQVCQKSATCIIGGSVMDSWTKGRP